MIYFSGWWLTYPSEKYDFDGCSLRMMRWNNCTELGDWGESLCVSLSSMCLQNLEPTKNSRSILRGYVFPICFFWNLCELISDMIHHDTYDSAWLASRLTIAYDKSILIGKKKWNDVVVLRSTLHLNKSTCHYKL